MRECDSMLARSDTGAGQPVALIIDCQDCFFDWSMMISTDGEVM